MLMSVCHSQDTAVLLIYIRYYTAKILVNLVNYSNLPSFLPTFTTSITFPMQMDFHSPKIFLQNFLHSIFTELLSPMYLKQARPAAGRCANTFLKFILFGSSIFVCVCVCVCVSVHACVRARVCSCVYVFTHEAINN